MYRILIPHKTHGYANAAEFVDEYKRRVKGDVVDGLNRYHPTNAKRRSILTTLITNIDELLTGHPVVLEKWITKFQKNGTLKYIQANPDFRQRLEKIFNYKGFRQSKLKGGWLGRIMPVKACLYCNSQFTLNLKKAGRPAYTFDHFFAKKDYPFFSVSLYNLIPACGHCNQSKSKKDFPLAELINPHIDSYDSFGIFETDKKSIIKFVTSKYSDPNHIQLRLKLKGKKDVLKSQKFENQLKSFHLEDIYENHKEIVGDIYIRAKIYTTKFKAYLKSLGANNPANFLDEEHINRVLAGNYLLSRDINKRPLAKLYKDISKEAGLIK